MSRSRGVVDEISAVLIDGEAHVLSDFYHHIANTIDVATAVRHFELRKIPGSVKNAGAAGKVIENDPERAVSDGRKIIILRTLRYMVIKKDIEAVGLESEGIDTLSEDNLCNIVVRATPQLISGIFPPEGAERNFKARGTRVFDIIRGHMRSFATRGGRVSFTPPKPHSFDKQEEHLDEGASECQNEPSGIQEEA